MCPTDEERWRPYVAVSALIWRDEQVLMLHRVQPPLIWAPPGGRVEANEEPYGALRREICEETSLEGVQIVAPCIIEAGYHEGKEILFLDFAVRCMEGEIALDPHEHDAWQWFDFGHLEAAAVKSELASGGEPYYVFHWEGEVDDLACSHSPDQLRWSRLVLDCGMNLRRHVRGVNG